MVPYLYSHSDVIANLQDWAGFSGASSADFLRKIKRSIEAAYRVLTNLHDWRCYVYRGRINTNASYNTGTLAYTNSTRTATLSGGTLPSNTELCTCRINNVDYPVEKGSVSGNTFRMSVNANPNADLAAGTSYMLYQDLYPLPVNFRNMGTLRDANRSRIMEYMSINEWVASRLLGQGPTIPYRYTIMGERSYQGVQAIGFYPPPDQFYQYDYMGFRYPRPLTCPIPYTTGTVSTSTTTVTGTGTTFTSAMVGCIIRSAGNATAVTGTIGSNPYVAQRVITAFNSATSLTIDQALTTEWSAANYEISDPIDMDAGAMYTAFLKRCEFELGQAMQRDDVSRLKQQYDEAVRLAMEADNRSFDHKPGGNFTGTERVPDYFPVTTASN